MSDKRVSLRRRAVQALVSTIFCASKCPGLPAAFDSARRNAGRAIASGSPEKKGTRMRHDDDRTHREDNVLPLHESAQPGSRQTEFFNDTIARVRKVSVVAIGHRSLSNTTVALGYCWPRILLLAPRFCLVYSALSPRMCPMARIATSPAT